MITRRVSGRIAYRAQSGEETGRERFELLSHSGGHVLRASCEIDETALLRDVTLAMDRDWRPLDAFLRLTKGGEPLASLFYDIREGECRAAGTVGGKPIADLRLATRSRLPYFGLHPLQGDALIVRCRGTERPGTFVTIHGATNSISPDGDERPGLFPVAIDVCYLEEGFIEVAAGRWSARRYLLRWSPHWPPAELWVRASDVAFLKMTWPHVPTWYEAVELSTSDV